MFNTGNHPTVGDPLTTAKRNERRARIAGDLRRALFFTLILVVVAFVLYQFVTATAT